MKHLITNLSRVDHATLHGAIAARLNPLDPKGREDSFGSIIGAAASELNLRAVVEFSPDRVHATFLNLSDASPIAFHLAEGRQ